MSDPAVDEFSFLPAQAAEIGATVPPVRRQSIRLADGRSISALRFGTTAPRIAFLHGAGLNAHTFDRTVLALGRPSLSVDLPGHGDSSWRDDAEYTARSLAPDVVAALSEWTDGRLVLVGHSLGGLTAAAVAASAADLVAALVLVDIAPGIDPNGGPRRIREFFAGPTDWASRDDLVDRALAFGLGGDRRSAERGVFLNSRIRPDGRVEWKHHFARIAHDLAADAAAAAAADERQSALASVLSARGWDDLAAVRAPVTLVRGDGGFLSEADVATISARLPRASVRTLASGHNIQEERPIELAEIIAAVGNNLDPGSAE